MNIFTEGKYTLFQKKFEVLSESAQQSNYDQYIYAPV